MGDALFAMAESQPEFEPGMSADRRRTVRQARALAAGSHPLSLALNWHLSLHADAAPAADRKADGLRCGGCRFREDLAYQSRSHPKCTHGNGARMSHGAGTDVRAWWPACVDHVQEDDDA